MTKSIKSCPGGFKCPIINHSISSSAHTVPIICGPTCPGSKAESERESCYGPTSTAAWSYFRGILMLAWTLSRSSSFEALLSGMRFLCFKPTVSAVYTSNQLGFRVASPRVSPSFAVISKDLPQPATSSIPLLSNPLGFLWGLALLETCHRQRWTTLRLPRRLH